MINEALFSNKKNDWETPDALYSKLNEEFHFTLDAAATAENTKCPKFISPEQDALSQLWGDANDVIWLNPPYKGVGRWLKQAYDTAEQNKSIVVCLVPARTDTKWFSKYACYGVIRFIKGRLKFKGAQHSAPFPSMLVIFNSAVRESFGLGPDNIVATIYEV
jgi:phage N-6-adenine-methyltransferase